MGTILGLLSGALQIPLKILTNMLGAGFKMVIQYHKESISFAREAGLTAKQAEAYTKVLATRAKDLGEKYGIAAEQVQKLERNLQAATGRQLMLSNQSAEKFVQLNKLVGEATTSRFSEEIINGMGGQISTVEGAVSKAYSTAAKSGLNAQKFAEKVAQNLSMANRLSFRNGIDGITKMAALSEKLGINMQSVESAASNFMEIDKAIENAARMQMLGGSAAVNFGNPLTAAYEANYDPEAFAKRMSDSLASYAEFDANKGISNINGMNMDFIRGIAQAMGISVDDASKMAKKQAEVQYKNNNFGTTLDTLSGGDEQIRDLLLNKSQIKNGKMTMIDSSGIERNMEYYQTEEGKKELDKMTALNGMSDEEIMKQQALSLTSIDEKIKGIMTSISGIFAKTLSPILPKIQEFVGDIGKTLIQYSGPIAENVKRLMEDVIKNWPWLQTRVEELAKGLLKTTEFLTKNWKNLLIGLLGSTVVVPLIAAIVGSSIGNRFGGRRGRNGGATSKSSSKGKTKSKSNASNSSRTSGGKTKAQIRNYQNNSYKLSKGVKNSLKNAYETGIKHGASKFQSAKGAIKAMAKNSKLLKIKGGGGAAGILSVGLAGLDIYNTVADSSEKKQQIKKSNLSNTDKEKQIKKVNNTRDQDIGGTAAGTAAALALGGKLASMGAAYGLTFGPVGAAIGGLLGGAIGGIGGYYAGDFLGRKGVKGVQDMTSEKHANGGIVGNVSNPAGEKIMSVANSKSSVTSLEASKFTNGGIVGGNSFSGDNILARLNSNELVLNTNQQNVVAKELSTVKAKPVGGREYIYTPRNSETSNINGSQVTVKDFNVNISGTIRLDGGNTSKNIDVRQLLNDYSFVSSLKDIIKESINTDMNNGRFLNDFAVRRGQTSSSSIVGKN